MTAPAPRASEISAAVPLAKTIGAMGFFTLAFGTIVGSGWVLTLGEWFSRAAPGGTLLGLIVGGAVLMAVGACYAELATRMPRAGGEMLYVLESFGPFPAFIVGWFIALNAIAVCAFEGIALGWFWATLFPHARFDVSWRVFGHSFDGQPIIIGTIAALAVGALHALGARVAIRFQNVVTITFLSVMAMLIAVGTASGRAENIQPLLEHADGQSIVSGIFWVFATAAFFLNGFQTALHALEEKRSTVSIQRAVNAMLLAIAAATLFYCALVIATGLAAPWEQTIKADLPAVAALGQLSFGKTLATITLAAATLSLLKTWTAVALMGSRIVFSQARLGFLPAPLSQVHPVRGAPTAAILFVTVCTLIGISLGRSFISAIISMSAICMSISFVICIACLLRQRARSRVAPAFEVRRLTIGVALCGASVMAAVAFIEPLIRQGGGVPKEWWLMLVWSALGVIGWISSRGPAAARGQNRSGL